MQLIWSPSSCEQELYGIWPSAEHGMSATHALTPEHESWCSSGGSGRPHGGRAVL
jgi:hypothetical protein